MKRAWILLAVVALVATFALAGGEKGISCNTVASIASGIVGPETDYRNHGQYVRAAAGYLNSVWPNITEACHDCVMAGFAQSDANSGSCNFQSGQ